MTDRTPLLVVDGDKPASVIDQIHTETPGSRSGFDAIFWRRFGRLWRIGFAGWCSPLSRRLYIIWFMSVVSGVLLFLLGQISAQLGSAIVSLDAGEVLRVLGTAGAAVAVHLVMNLAGKYLSAMLALQWRAKIVEELHGRYFDGKSGYWLNCIDARVDNADQRITEDVAQLTNVAGAVLFGGYNVGIQGSIVNVLVQAILSIAFVLANIDIVPLAVCSAYVILSFVITTALLAPVARATYATNQEEGNFRFFHARVREYSECIAMYHGHVTEAITGSKVFNAMYTKFRVLFRYQFFLSVWASFQGNIADPVALSTVMLVIRLGHGLLYGAAPTQFTVQSAFFAVDTYIGALVAIPVLYSTCGPLAGYTHRVGQLFEALDELDKAEEKLATANVAAMRTESSSVQLVNVAFHAPGGRLILSNVSLTVQPGRSLLIMGPSGAGKSSVLRVMAGLWPFDSGALYTPARGSSQGMFFVPQRPYVLSGSLREQILYPNAVHEQRGDDRSLMGILEAVGLSHLMLSGSGLDTVHDWDGMLSAGEQQRLGFARLLYHRPAFAIMDEATSAMEEQLQARCMRLAMDSRITCISVGHRPSLVLFHQDIMVLDGAGGYSLMTTEEYAQSAQHRASFDRLLTVPEQEAQNQLEAAAAVFSELRTASRFSIADADTLSIGTAGVEEEPQLVPAPKVEIADRIKLDLGVLRKSWKLLCLGFPRILSVPFGVLLLSIAVTVLAAYSQIAVLMVMGPIFQAILQQDWSQALYKFSVAVLMTLFMSVSTNWAGWLGNILQLYWYKSLVERAQAAYLRQKMVYGANHLVPDLDNMDQRICEDCRAATQQLSILLFGAQGQSSVLLTLVTIGIAMWDARSFGFMPIASAVAYALIFVLATWFISKPVAPAQYQQNKSEGDFRHAHIRFREFNESIAFYRGEDKERRSASQLFETVFEVCFACAVLLVLFSFVHAQRSAKLIRAQLPVYGFTMAGASFSDVFAFLLLAFLALSTHSLGGQPVTLSNLVTGASVVLALMLATASLPSYMTTFSVASGYIHRVDNMLNTVEELAQVYAKFEAADLVRDDENITVSGITIKIPAGRELLHDLSFSVTPGDSLVIMGPSGCGKSSIVRVICGLWPFDTGLVKCPQHIGRDGVYVLPQRPYIFTTSLCDLLLYPHNSTNRESPGGDDAQLTSRLHELGLGHLLQHVNGDLHAVEAWADMLSVGEQQRVGFIRLLYHQPKFAIMDEATSALDLPMEIKCMSLCVQSGITLVSVAHRPTLAKYHRRLLLLDGSGGYKLRNL